MDQNTDIKGSIEALKAIASEIQASVALATYQEEEDEDSYKELIDEFESRLMDIHVDVANHFPLQLEAFEENLSTLTWKAFYCHACWASVS